MILEDAIGVMDGANAHTPKRKMGAAQLQLAYATILQSSGFPNAVEEGRRGLAFAVEAAKDHPHNLIVMGVLGKTYSEFCILLLEAVRPKESMECIDEAKKSILAFQAIDNTVVWNNLIMEFDGLAAEAKELIAACESGNLPSCEPN